MKPDPHSAQADRIAWLRSVCVDLASITLVAAVALVGAACSGQSVKDPDGDENRQKARAFLRTGPTEDKLDANVGDFEDWRFFLPEKTRWEIRISIGKWEESTIQGFVTVYTEVGDRVLERTISPGSQITIKETFDVDTNMRYLVRFKATAGKGKYAVEVGEPEDPCAACTDKQECVEQKCVEKPCGGGCEEGLSCDKPSGKCVKKRDRADPPENKCAGVDCSKGETCQRSTGRCVAVGSPGPATIGGGPEKEPDIDCAIIDAREAGTGAILTLSAGDNKGVKKGMKGVIKGVKGGAFTVIEVYPSRSKATCTTPPSKLVGNTQATIKH